MITEDLQRPLQPTATPEDQKLVRQLPVISATFLNPESVRLKKLQESTVAAMAAPKMTRGLPGWSRSTWGKFFTTEDITVSSASSSFRTKVNTTPLPEHHHKPIPNPASILTLTLTLNHSIQYQEKTCSHVGKRRPNPCTRTTKDNS